MWFMRYTDYQNPANADHYGLKKDVSQPARSYEAPMARLDVRSGCPSIIAGSVGRRRGLEGQLVRVEREQSLGGASGEGRDDLGHGIEHGFRHGPGHGGDVDVGDVHGLGFGVVGGNEKGRHGASGDASWQPVFPRTRL
jgi:hypothetical protein